MTTKTQTSSGGMAAPFREPVFRRIWTASLFSNLGQQMQAVAAAWTMLELTHQADLVAMVQTASMLPVMLLAVAAGAIADMYDRRMVALFALCLSLAGASLLAIGAAVGALSPEVILICCFITGVGISIYSPAWQASAAEIVGPKAMPAAVALYALSSNAARSVGPALGGILIAAGGVFLTFGLNALFYLPIIGALLLWKRQATPNRLPRERLDRAMLAGLRFVRHSPPIRRVMIRSLISATGGAAVYSMMPLVARVTLGGGPGTYGVLLGSFGLGAVLFGLTMARVRERFSSDHIVTACSLVLGAAIVIMGKSPYLALDIVAMVGAGGAWMIMISTYNVAVQLSSPRWVGGRTLATFQAAVAAGLAGGALLWGWLASTQDVVFALSCAGGMMTVSVLLGRLLPLPGESATEAVPPVGDEPLVKMAISGRSGPLAIEVEYRVRNNDAREFYHAMRNVLRSRERNGAFNVTLSRDLADPEVWVERFHYPTWNDYLRSRHRPTVDDRQQRDLAVRYHQGDEPIRIRRYLERPSGSVRSRDDALDPGEAITYPST